jgi:hypothetical protein
MNYHIALEREEDALCSDLADGNISRAEYDECMRELREEQVLNGGGLLMNNIAIKEETFKVGSSDMTGIENSVYAISIFNKRTQVIVFTGKSAEEAKMVCSLLNAAVKPTSVL